MFVLLRTCVLAGLVVGGSLAAAAQQIPSSEQPGRERQRFIEQPKPKAKASAATISLLSTTTPEGAATIQLLVHDVRFVGATVYAERDLRALAGDLVGQFVTLTAY